MVSSRETMAEVRAEIQLKWEATSMQQAAEGGMRGLQSSFLKLKDCFVYEERGEQWIILKMIVLLYNM